MSSCDGGEDGEYTGVRFKEISGIFALHGAFVFGTEPFEIV